MLIAASIGDFVQPRNLWVNWTSEEKNVFVANVAGNFKAVTAKSIKKNQRMLYSACQ
jgi:catalase